MLWKRPNFIALKLAVLLGNISPRSAWLIKHAFQPLCDNSSGQFPSRLCLQQLVRPMVTTGALSESLMLSVTNVIHCFTGYLIEITDLHTDFQILSLFCLE